MGQSARRNIVLSATDAQMCGTSKTRDVLQRVLLCDVIGSWGRAQLILHVCVDVYGRAEEMSAVGQHGEFGKLLAQNGAS
jgi:hypothetical protein